MRLATELAVEAARTAGVCERPILRQVTDRLTGETSSVPIPCGSTREDVCKACAEKARRLRMQQCREGWHLTDDPLPDEADDSTEADAAADDTGDEGQRRVRSTRRLAGFPELPKVAVEHCTVGHLGTGADSAGLERLNSPRGYAGGTSREAETD